MKALISSASGTSMALFNIEPFATAQTIGNSLSAFTPVTCCAFSAKSSPSTLAVFSVDAQNGQLALFGHYPTENQPRGMAVDPSGRWLAVAGQLSHHLTIYEIDAETGCPRQRFRVATGEDPICVEILALP